MRPTGTCRLVLAMLVAGPLVACEARSLVPDAGMGTGGGGKGGGGEGGGGDPSGFADLLSDFEDLAGATVVMAGTPPRNGYWYTYNDDNPKGTDPTCIQIPPSWPQVLPGPPATYVGEAPPTAVPVTMGQIAGALSLHAKWTSCSVWGAGIGADINSPPVSSGTVYMGPKVPYDLSTYTAITFLAMAAVGSDTLLRLKLPMRATTRTEDGGTCVESAVNKCSDEWGEQFTLPSNGTWKRITVRFSNPTFRQEGWGAVFPWNPSDVTGVQIQSVDKGEAYDFWIDDMYLLR